MTPEIIAHLWQSTLFVSAAWLVTLALRTNQAQVRYWVWFTASAKFLLPFSLLIGLGTLLPHRTAAPIPTTWGAVVEELSQPLALPPIAPHVNITGAQNHNYVAAIFALWACGFLAVAITWLLRWRRVQILRRSAQIINLPTTLQIPVPIMSAPDVLEPGIYGLLRPVLLLPDGIAERLTQSQLDAILAHEFCHVRRKDNLTATIHMAVQAIFWFHPLTWWIGTRLVDERERACDEEVLRQGCQPNVYAESILTVCKLYLESPLTCVSGVTGSDLKKRIEEIMRNRTTVGLNLVKKLFLAVAAMTVLIVPIVVGILTAPFMIRAQDDANSGIAQNSSEAAQQPVGAPGTIFTSASSYLAFLHHKAYAVISGDSTVGFTGFHRRRPDRAQALRGKVQGDYIWYERDGRSYVIIDAATVMTAKELFTQGNQTSDGKAARRVRGLIDDAVHRGLARPVD